MEKLYFSESDINGIVATFNAALKKNLLSPARNIVNSLIRLWNKALEGKVDIENHDHLFKALTLCTANLPGGAGSAEGNNYAVQLGTALHEVIDLVAKNRELERQIQCLEDDREHLYDRWIAANEDANKWCSKALEQSQEKLDLQEQVKELKAKAEASPEVVKRECRYCVEFVAGVGCGPGVTYANACLGNSYPLQYNRFCLRK